MVPDSFAEVQCMKLHFGIALDASYGNLDKEDHCCTEFFVSIYRNVFPDYRGGLFLNMRHHSIIHFLLLCMLSSCLSDSPGGIDSMQKDRSMVDRSPEQYIRISDSLLKKYDGKRDVSERISILLSRQRAFSLLGLMDSVLSTGVLIRAEAVTISDSISMARSLLPIRGDISMTDQAAFESYLPGAIRAFQKAGLAYEEGVIQALMGGILARKGQFSESIGHLYAARDILEGMDSIRPLYSIYMNIGNDLSAMEKPEASLEYYRMSGAVAGKLKDSLRMGNSLMNAGIVHSILLKYDSSRWYFDKALTMLPARGGEMLGMQVRFNQAIVFEKEGRLSEAEAIYRDIFRESKQQQQPVGEGMSSNAIARIMGNTGRMEEAILLMRSSMADLKRIGYTLYELDQLQLLIDLYKRNGKYAEALTAFQQYKHLSDSVLSAEKFRSIDEVEARYQVKRKDAENDLLKQKVRFRNLLTIGLLTLTVALTLFLILLRQRNHYQRALVRNYQTMLARYLRERDGSGNLPASGHISGSANVDDARSSAADPSSASNGDDEKLMPTAQDTQDYERIRTYFLAEKPYLNPRLRVEDVAQHLGMVPRRLSTILKYMGHQGFNAFVNRYRVDEATRIMDREDSLRYKIDTIANECGFNNRQHFRRVFEQVTGVNPGFYRDHIGQVPDEVDQEIV